MNLTNFAFSNKPNSRLGQLLSGVFYNGYGGVFDPFASLMSTLLADATQLIAHPLEYGSMFQDRAGTIPVTASGQLIGRVLDAGGGNYHATAISEAARMVFRDVGGFRWVEYNGINGAYSTPALPAPLVDKAQVFAGVRKLSDASLGVIGSLAASVSVTGALTLDSRRYAAGDYAMTIRNASANSVQNFVTYNAPTTNVLSALYDQSGANIDEELSLRVDGVLSAKGGVSLYNAGSANFASAPIYLGAQGGTSAFFNGRSYATLGPITRFSAANATAEQIEAAEAYYTARVI